MISGIIFGHFLAIFGHFLVIFCLFLSPTQTVVHLLALINTFSLGVIISTFIYCEIDVLPTFRTENCVIFSLINMIFCYWEVYGASPTEIEKMDFFQILRKNIFVLIIFSDFSFINLKNYILMSHGKKFRYFWWKLRVFLMQGIKRGKNMKKLSKKVNIFQIHFLNDFPIFCIFPMWQMYHTIREKSDMYKKIAI